MLGVSHTATEENIESGDIGGISEPWHKSGGMLPNLYFNGLCTKAPQN
jgi:hypothetical protein